MAEVQHFSARLKNSGAGRKPDQRATLLGLGLKRFGKTVYLKDTPAIRGMLYKVCHLVEIETHKGAPPPSNRARARAAKN